jgi:hypothetical protein
VKSDSLRSFESNRRTFVSENVIGDGFELICGVSDHFECASKIAVLFFRVQKADGEREGAF